MKKFLKYFLLIILILAIGFVAYIKLKPAPERELFSYVPEDAALMIYTTHGTKNWQKIRASEAWKILENNEIFAQVKKSMYKADTVMNKNKMAGKLLKDRAVLVSLHPDKKRELQPLVFVDLKDFSNLSFSMDLLQSRLLERVDYKGKRIDYHDKKIFRIRDLKKDKKFYLTLTGNALVISPELSMVKHCLDESENYWMNQTDFKKLITGFKDQGYLQLYLNFEQLTPYVEEYTSENKDLSGWINSLQYAGFELDIDDNNLVFNGSVSNADSVAGYLNAFKDISPGKSAVHKWLTKNTASYVSMRFDQFNELNQNFLEQLAALDSKSYRQYINQTQMIEDKFDIDISNHIFNWINNEVVVGKIRPEIGVGRAEDVFIAFRTSNIQTAKEMLGEITGNISHKTPLKFRTRNYEEHEIQYLDLNGFFKIFAGNIFQKIERPYFTFIDDFVVFSNSASNLKTLIEDFYENRVLDEVDSFQYIRKKLNSKSNIDIYLQTRQMYSTLYYLSNFSAQQKMEKYRDLMLCIKDLGISIKPGQEFLKAQMVITLNAEIKKDPLVSVYESEASKPANKRIENLEFRFDPQSFNIPNDTTGMIKIFYPDSTLWYEGEIENGHPDGLWRTYYNSGNLKSSVLYENGVVNNYVVFFYDNPGNTIQIKAKFENNKIEGKYLEYHENGRLKAKINYESGIPNGEGKFYYPDGRLMREGKYKEGNKKGLWKYYNIEGELSRKKKY